MDNFYLKQQNMIFGYPACMQLQHTGWLVINVDFLKQRKHCHRPSNRNVNENQNTQQAA